jgi:hypothetical protein
MIHPILEGAPGAGVESWGNVRFWLRLLKNSLLLEI